MKVKELSTGLTVDLNQNNFLAAGGEGKVYRINDICYKVYTDPGKMLPVGKIQELQKLSSKNIINPISLISNSTGTCIGYSMKFAKNCITLCSIFSQTFKDRNNIQLNDINKLIVIMKQVFEEFHKNKMLIVDANEYNFLVQDKYFNDLFLIDVDSCQTAHYPATAIMESIKDYSANHWSDMSDWFSFAVLTFQMYTGLHPFRGKHAVVTNFTERLRQNLSVYDKDVAVPAFIKDFENKIPVNYNDWYKKIFTSSHREAPPASFADKITKITRQIKVKIGNFDIELVKTCLDTIIFFKSKVSFSKDIILTKNGLYIGDVKYPDVAPYAEVVLINDNSVNYVYSCITKNDLLLVRDVINRKDVECAIAAEHIIGAAESDMNINQCLYVIYNNILSYVEIFPSFNKVISKKLSDLVTSYQVFTGVVIQSVLDTVYVTLLRGKSGILENISIKELSGQRIINAELKNNVLIIITEQNGDLKRNIIRFYKDSQYFSTYTIMEQKNITDSEINFIVLDTGVCILSELSQGLVLFRSNPDDPTINIVNDNMIVGYKFISKANKAMYIDDTKIYSFKMK